MKTRALLVPVLALVVGSNAAAANYPLQLLHPRAAGTSPDPGGPTISPDHRIFFAYPGVEYDIRAVVTGGAYPYYFSLAGAPDGMTIDPCTGEVSWASPQGDAMNVVMTVVDAEGTSVSEAWSIAVDPDRFAFVDAVNGVHAANNGCGAGCGTGAFDNPWRSISDAYLNGHDGTVGKILYFRTGTYDVLDLPRSGVGGPWERVEMHEDYQPISWLEWPGDAAVIDFGFDAANPGGEPGPLIRFWGQEIYLDGFETTRSHYIAFQTVGGSDYPVLRRMVMTNHGPGLDGTNASLIMTMGHGLYSHYMAQQDNEVHGVTSANATKIYSQVKLVLEDNDYHDHVQGFPIELKDDMVQFTVQNNRFENLDGSAIGGNMHTLASGEIRFNNVPTAPIQDALRLNQDGMAGEIYVYRNTFVGRVHVSATDAQDGPFTFSDNVRVDGSPEGGCVAGSRIYCQDVTAPEQIVLTAAPGDDLECAPDEGCVDALGLLQGSQREELLGVKGHERVGECADPTGSGGSGGEGGSTGEGGASSGTAGNAADPIGDGAGEGGCACRIAAPRGATPGWVALVALTAWMRRRRLAALRR